MSFKQSVILIFILALFLRLGLLFSEHPVGLGGDESDYVLLAKNLYEKGEFVAHEGTPNQFQGGKPGNPTAFRTVVLPGFIAIHFYLFGEDLLPPRISLVIISALTCIFIALLGRNLFNSKTGILSSLIWALYPTVLFSWYGSHRFYPEGLSIFFLLISFHCLLLGYRKRSHKNIMISGIFLSMAILTRGYLALILPVTSLFLFIFNKEKRFVTTLIFVLSTSLIIGLWGLRNYFVMGKFMLSTQTDSFYWGNNAWARGSIYGDVYELPMWTAPQVQPLLKKYPNIKEFSEVELSEIWPKEGLLYLKENPVRGLWLMFRKTAIFILPIQDWQIGFYKFHYLYFLLFLFAIFGFIRADNKTEIALIFTSYFGAWIAILMTLTLCRYRYTIEPFIVMLGSYGLIEALNFVCKKIK